MSTISAGNTTTTTLVQTGDTTGNLVFTTGGANTVVLTLDNTQTATFTNPIKGGAITTGTVQNSTSGTSIDFTSIPSWVKRITVMFAGVSTSGTSSLRIQLGDSGGIETSGYTGSTSTIQTGTAGTVVTASAGFDLNSASAGNTVAATGSVVLLAFGSNQWIASGWVGYDASTQSQSISGRKTTSGTLDRVRITTVNGTDTFDAGSINILYE